MNVKDEAKVYYKAKVSVDTGEIEEFDQVIFPNVIRKREIDLICSRVRAIRPKRVLDFGCGGGWLSKVLAFNGQNVIGIDVSRRLIRYAKKASPDSEFIVGDCMNLPFREKSLDAIIGVAILHHVNSYSALRECRRVTAEGSLLLFMEPNKLNPISALGRKILPMQTHTRGEHPFTLQELTGSITKAELTIKEIKQIFPYSFGLARLFRGRSFPKIIAPIVSTSERLLEKIPMIKFLSSTFFVVITRN